MRDIERKYRNRLLSFLPPDSLARLERHLTPVSIHQGTTLVREGEPFTEALFLESGVVSYLTQMADGLLVESVSTGREGAVGLQASATTGIALRTAVVQMSGEALAMPLDRLRAAFNEDEAVRKMVMHYTAVALSQVLQRVACNARHGVEARIAWWLLLNKDRIDGGTLEAKHDTLAVMLGVQRSTVTLAARSMQAAGLIRYARGVIELLDLEGLSEVSCECYEKMRLQFNNLLPVRDESPV